MAAPQRREHELRLAGGVSSRSRAGSVSAIVRTVPCFGGVNACILAFHCWPTRDRVGLEVDPVPAERVELARPHPLVDGGVQVGGERGRQLVRKPFEGFFQTVIEGLPLKNASVALSAPTRSH